MSHLLLAGKIAGMKVVSALDNLFFTLTAIDVKELLSNEGAAAEGGALAPVNEQVKNYGGGAYTIARNAGVYIVAASLIIGGIVMAVHSGNAGKRDEDKTAFLWKIVAAIVIFGGVSILVFAQKIGEALFL